jgi:hypothetical protein
MKLSEGARYGLHQYHMQKAEIQRHQCMRLPPVQHNFSRLTLAMGRQFLLAMSMPGVHNIPASVLFSLLRRHMS